jgi:hypothetical protein
VTGLKGDKQCLPLSSVSRICISRILNISSLTVTASYMPANKSVGVGAVALDSVAGKIPFGTATFAAFVIFCSTLCSTHGGVSHIRLSNHQYRDAANDLPIRGGGGGMLTEMVHKDSKLGGCLC